jgi:UDP-N-acetylmuramoylalanine--D-glutamate ligase
MRIGIAGCGVVGMSMLAFVARHGIAHLALAVCPSVPSAGEILLDVWDQRTLNDEERRCITRAGASFIDGSHRTLKAFIDGCDICIVSAGIDLYMHGVDLTKCVTEVDVFYALFKRPVIAVTGTLGKTTVTQLLGTLLTHQAGRLFAASRTYRRGVQHENTIPPSVVVGGNIGVGLLDLIDNQATIGVAVIELSSFQLEHAQHYAPDIAVWTNFSPNHLDRHGTIAAYFKAKARLLASQHALQSAVLPVDLFEGSYYDLLCTYVSTARSKWHVVSDVLPGNEVYARIKNYGASIIYVHNGMVWVHTDKGDIPLISCAVLPEQEFKTNWLTIIATLYATGADCTLLNRTLLEETLCAARSVIGEHRLEYCGMVRGVAMYNDSKATVAAATKAAVNRLMLTQRPILLIVGGTSKGVPRRDLVEFIKGVPLIKKAVCCGPYAHELDPFLAYPTLEDAVRALLAEACEGDQLLFSPGGASFDMFDNYRHRGTVFKEIIARIMDEG